MHVNFGLNFMFTLNGSTHNIYYATPFVFSLFSNRLASVEEIRNSTNTEENLICL